MIHRVTRTETVGIELRRCSPWASRVRSSSGSETAAVGWGLGFVAWVCGTGGWLHGCWLQTRELWEAFGVCDSHTNATPSRAQDGSGVDRALGEEGEAVGTSPSLQGHGDGHTLDGPWGPGSAWDPACDSSTHAVQRHRSVGRP